MSSDRQKGLAHLEEAYRAPWQVADEWRSAGGIAVGVVGYFAPRELVVAAGLLPVRLRPGAMVRAHSSDAPPQIPRDLEGLADGLPRQAVQLLGALLAGELDWIDALMIGRDSDSHTRLFYVLRELAGDPHYGTAIPPIAFSDLLRLPLRTSAVYNRRRLAELRDRISDWAGHEISAADISRAIADDGRTAEMLVRLNRLRLDGRLSGRDALIAAGASTVLPGEEFRTQLLNFTEDAVARSVASRRPRIFLTGSDVHDPDIYAAIESSGFLIVGEDHGWGDDGAGHAKLTVNPIDGLADRYQFSSRVAARSGLERAAMTAERVRAAGADVLLQIILGRDEAPAWELHELRALSGAPVVSIDLRLGADEDWIGRVAESIRARLQGRQRVSLGAGAGDD
jgi:benzoyl-CoA reductase/2-hydroxyglutaryl-CoA dehydratase subunit BcrC/BadD/HgdB